MAAGRGTRMCSQVPKVVHPLCGRPLVYYPVRAALELGAARVVVVASPDTRAEVERSLLAHVPAERLQFATQSEEPGTGGAAKAGMRALSREDSQVLILNGDVPLLRGRDLLGLREEVEAGAGLAVLTFLAPDATGYGRILRDATGRPSEIREERDLETQDQRAIREVNAGAYLAQRERLEAALLRLNPGNAQREYYLTDIVRLMAEDSLVRTCLAPEAATLGVNDRVQLGQAEALLFRRIRERHQLGGVTFCGDVLVDDSVELEADVRLEHGVRLRGETRIGARTVVDAGSIIDDSHIGSDVLIKPHSVISGSVVESRAVIGPFAHLRPESHIEADAHVGNFVETKKTRLGRGAKANHLAYLGDADIGEKSNLGAGVIVCNYDGFAKRRTVVGRHVFVGSDSQLIAPTHIGDGAYVATGTTVTGDVPPDALVIGRVRAATKPGYASGLRSRLADRASAEKSPEEPGGTDPET